MHRIAAHPVTSRPTQLRDDPSILSRYLEDAAHYPGGHASAVARPANVEEVAWVVQQSRSVLAIGAQSSLTGGATPAGDTLLSTEKLSRITVHDDEVTVGAGVTLSALQDTLRAHGRWFPPVPTYLGATVGGAISTNAAGAATFKYGAVRPWVRALTVVLATGDVLRLRRGEVTSSPEGTFVVDTSYGAREIQVPSIRLPDVPKCSAGYYSAPQMDLIDLFIGAEGTLGVVVEADLATASRPAGVVWLLVALPNEAAAIHLASDLRNQQTLDVAAIEHIDPRSIAILREDAVDRRLGVAIPEWADTLLLVQIEIRGKTADAWSEAVMDAIDALVQRHGAEDATLVALPTEPQRARAFVDLREAVPAGVNRRVGLAHARDARVHKTAADVIVPFSRFGEMMQTIRAMCHHAGLDLAVWGHISDGNVHPNIVPRDYTDVKKGADILVELAHQVIAMGGSPLAEHGVGRNPVKQHLLQLLHGSDGVAGMRSIKRQLDPEWKLGPGVLFER